MHITHQGTAFKFSRVRDGVELPEKRWWRSWSDGDLDDWLLEQEADGWLKIGDSIKSKDQEGHTYLGGGRWALAA